MLQENIKFIEKFWQNIKITSLVCVFFGSAGRLKIDDEKKQQEEMQDLSLQD